jgi:hypothetical protein
MLFSILMGFLFLVGASLMLAGLLIMVAATLPEDREE